MRWRGYAWLSKMCGMGGLKFAGWLLRERWIEAKVSRSNTRARIIIAALLPLSDSEFRSELISHLSTIFNVDHRLLVNWAAHQADNLTMRQRQRDSQGRWRVMSACVKSEAATDGGSWAGAGWMWRLRRFASASAFRPTHHNSTLKNQWKCSITNKNEWSVASHFHNHRILFFIDFYIFYLYACTSNFHAPQTTPSIVCYACLCLYIIHVHTLLYLYLNIIYKYKYSKIKYLLIFIYCLLLMYKYNPRSPKWVLPRLLASVFALIYGLIPHSQVIFASQRNIGACNTQCLASGGEQPASICYQILTEYPATWFHLPIYYT